MNTQKTKHRFLIWMIFIITFGLLLSTAHSKASVITWDLEKEYTDATPPAGPTPWLTAIIDDEVDPGNITLTLISNLTGLEFVNQWLFNYDTENFALTPSDFVYQSSSTGPEPTIQIGENEYNVPGDGYFDIQLDFENFASGDRFDPLEEVILTIIKPGLTAYSFNFKSELRKDGYEHGLLTAAHIGGISLTGDDSGWIVHNPEPSTIFLLLLGLIGLVGIRKKFRG